MSYIKRLKLQGFKSFANPTILNFEQGFNTVVGANGSGKSNVFDALCFVLGRMSSKGLRADKLGNLVFNGGKALKPAKEAEVSIFLSNEKRELVNVELDEIKITRVVKANGQSNYFLNNNKVTRTEIVEILHRAHIDPDGYNIILQGDIMRIVNMSPIERRELIEEISNISGYEEKREKAIKKLEKVDTELKDADLLMEEKTKYLKELKSEKEAAERFHKTKDDLRFKNLLLVKAKLVRNTNLRKKKEDELKENECKLSEFKEKLDQFESETKEIDTQISAIEKEIEIKSHNDFISVTNKITALEAEVQKIKEKKAENKKQIEEIKSREEGVKETIIQNKKSIAEFEKEIQNLEKEKKIIEKELQEVEKVLSKKKSAMNPDSFKELDEIDEQLDEINEKKLSKNHIRQDNAIQIEKLNTKLEHLQADLKKLEGNAAENKEQYKRLEVLRKEMKKLIIEISQRANSNSETSAKLHKLLQERSELIEEHSRLQMKASTSKDLMAINKAVDTILKFKAKDNAVRGTVAELASVPEKYSMALETVAGKSLFNIVVNDDKTAVKYINYLKEHRIGNATFLPMNKINRKFHLDSTIINKKGVVDYALNLIKFDREYEAIFNLVFSDTVVIDHIDNARGVGIGQYKMVTLDGDLVMKSGAMSGGFKSRSKGLGAFKDDKTIEKAEKMSERINKLRETISHLEDDKRTSEEKLYQAREKKAEIEGEVAKLEQILSIEGKDTSSIKGEIEAILSDRVVIEKSLSKIDGEIKELENKIEKLAQKKLSIKGNSGTQSSNLQDIVKVEENRDKLKEKLIELNSKLDTKLIQINNVLKPELGNLEKISNDAKTSAQRIKTLNDELSSKQKEIEEELKEFKEKEKELSKDYKDFIAKRDKLKEEKINIEKKYEKEFAKFDKIKEKSAELRYALNEYETLSKTLNEELEFLFEDLKVEFITEENPKEGEERINDLIEQVDSKLANSQIDVKELQSQVNNLKTKLNSFGSINMKAVQVYDKLSEEFNSLLEKRETLNEEKKGILDFINEMDEKKKVRFMQTFKQLEENFIRIFSELSTKGDAELIIENEKDLFNSGVEIRVRLSKKNYLDIKSLSGGEKTITAIAFIFAVQEFNPASFYIFDEVDAALDILNSEKLGKLIKKHAGRAQYIVVSHSEYLIQSSETIYGVTMNESKISGVVSLDLRDMKDYIDDTQEAKTA